MLHTPRGPRPFAVVAVYYDYAVDRGVIVMDRRDVREATSASWRRRGIAAYLARARTPSGCAPRSSSGWTRATGVFIYTNSALRAEVLRVFDSTFAITYALEIIAVVVAMLGVAATLLTLVIERRRELSMLRLIGAARRQVRRVVVIEAALIGGASQAIGLRGRPGAVADPGLRHQRAELRLDDSVPRAGGCSWLQVSVAVVIATAIAGVYPARRAAELVVAQARSASMSHGARVRLRVRRATCLGRAAARRSARVGSRRRRPGREADRRVSLRVSRATTPAIPTTRSSGGTTPATCRPRRAGASAIRSRSSASASTRRRSNPSRWAVRDLFMAHLAVSDPGGGRYRFDERLSRGGPGLAGAEADRYRVWNEDWRAGLDDERPPRDSRRRPKTAGSSSCSTPGKRAGHQRRRRHQPEGRAGR